MCGGPPKLIVGDTVRRYASPVLGRVTDIDKEDRRRFLYFVEFEDSGEVFPYPRGELLKVSRRSWEKRDQQRVIEMEKRILERRAARAAAKRGGA